MQSKQILITIGFFTFIFLNSFYPINAQFQTSIIAGIDVYQIYTNPYTKESMHSRSSGAVFSGIPIGVQLSHGIKNNGIALEAAANFAPLSLDLQEYKGLGAIGFPILLKYNYGALSGTSTDKLIGYSAGLGVQMNRTEWFGLSKNYPGLKRTFFRTYVLELAVGGGVGGYSMYLYTRIGAGADQALSFNIGILSKTQLFKSRQNKIRPQYQS